jgi:CubicO group peptidase (beta-lactamase class C family)
MRPARGARNVTTALLLLVAAASAAAAQPAQLRGFDDYVERALRDWNVPGVAVAVVRGDSVVFARGYGVREIGRPERVDAQTIFAIGSSTKALTAALVAMLVDEGHVQWSDPAAQHLPGFALFDPYATRELTVRDLLIHSSGLSRGDLVWYATELDRDDILRRVRHLEPSWSLRSQFGYQNIMYLAAGQLAARVTGRSWDELVRERIFAPLGMTASSTSVTALAGVTNLATPHAAQDGVARAVAYRNIDNIAPAGSVNSNVLDMAQWVRLQLGSGSFNGRELLKPETLAEMHEPHIVIRDPVFRIFSPDARFLTYGLGWVVQDHHGRKLVHHGGNIDGMSAMVAMIPEERLGVVILSNMNGSFLPSVLKYRVLDAFLGVPAKDWSAELRTVAAGFEEQQRQAERSAEEERVRDTRPSLPLERYAGTYRDELHGDVVVSHENGRLRLTRSPALHGELEHWHFNTFRTRFNSPVLPALMVSFALDARGNVASADVEGMAVFRRVDAERAAGARQP